MAEKDKETYYMCKSLICSYKEEETKKIVFFEKVYKDGSKIYQNVKFDLVSEMSDILSNSFRKNLIGLNLVDDKRNIIIPLKIY